MALFSDVKGQEESRRPGVLVDQFKRPWYGQIEIKTGDPCETLVPMGWSAPAAPSAVAGFLVPPSEFVKVVPSTQPKRRMLYQVFIDYEAWLDAWDHRQDVWWKKFVDVCKHNKLDVRTERASPSSDLIEVVGPPAFPPRAFIEAAAAGNKWALGLSDVVPDAAKAALAQVEEALVKRRRAIDRGPRTDPFASAEDEGEVAPFVPTRADPLAGGSAVAATILGPSGRGDDDDDFELGDDAPDALLDTALDRALTSDAPAPQPPPAAAPKAVGRVTKREARTKPEPATAGEEV